MPGQSTWATLDMLSQGRTARRSLGLICLALGVTGGILPIIPGLPFLVVGARLLGPRDPLLRRLRVSGRRSLRYMRRAKQPFLQRIGMRLTPLWQQAERLLTGKPHRRLALKD